MIKLATNRMPFGEHKHGKLLKYFDKLAVPNFVSFGEISFCLSVKVFSQACKTSFKE